MFCIIDNKNIPPHFIFQVLHSMRLREKPLNPWSVVNPDGTIQASHCDCMAGLGEVCSHVAAMLFTVMEIVRIRDTQTVTQEPAYWKFPTSMKKVEYKQVRDIDFTSTKSLKKQFERKLENTTQTVTSSPRQNRKQQVPPPTPDEVTDFLSKLHMTGQKAAILSVTEPYADEYVPTVEQTSMPQMLSDLKDIDALTISYGSLLERADEVELKVPSDEVNNVEVATRGQAKNKLWQDFRAGRVTASKMKQVCSTDPANPSQALIMSVCYPGTKTFSTDATKWGENNEKKARGQFVAEMQRQNEHINPAVTECGLYLSEEKPFIAASPDGIVECDCCGQSVLEIKCPYSHRDKALSNPDKGFYLVTSENGNVKLDKTHEYYFQVQTQLGVTGLSKAYFVVWTPIDLHIEIINFDKQFWEQICTSAEKIFRIALLPELIGKFYSRLPGSGFPTGMLEEKKTTDENERKNGEEERWCYCDQVESGQMIACDNQNCKLGWFHFACLKLDAPPKSLKWYCPDCRKLPEFKRKRKTLE